MEPEDKPDFWDRHPHLAENWERYLIAAAAIASFTFLLTR